MTESDIDLFERYLTDDLSAQEKVELAQRLDRDPEVQAAFVRYLEESQDLRVMLTQSTSGDIIDLQSFATAPSPRRQVRPIGVAAAVGILIGVLITSGVWAYAVPKIPEVSRIKIPLVDPGFEQLATPLAKSDSLATGLWTGDPTLVVTSRGTSVKPREGRAMLQMLPVESRRFCNIQQVVDVGHLVPPNGCAMELSAAFFCDGPARKSRFRIRVRAFAERGDELEAGAEDPLEFPIADLRRGIRVPPESTQWTTGRLELDLPPDTQTLVININAIDVPGTSRAAQYLDDVKAALLVTERPPASE